MGALLTGVFAAKSGTAFRTASYGNPKQLLIQATAVAAVIVYSGVVSFVILKVISLLPRPCVCRRRDARPRHQHAWRRAYLHE